MTRERLNRLSTIGLFFLSLTASVVPWTLAWLRGFDQPPPEDEETPARLFQLSIVLLVPMTLAFCATADWTRPRQIARRVALPALLVILSISALFYYEQVYTPAHFG